MIINDKILAHAKQELPNDYDGKSVTSCKLRFRMRDEQELQNDCDDKSVTSCKLRFRTYVIFPGSGLLS